MDKFNDFIFSGKRLDDIDIPTLGQKIGVGEDIVHGVLDTETGGKSVDANGRMKALYEPHIAYRNSKGAVREALVKAGLAYPKWKRDYPKDSYTRIKKAIAIDETVACLATSWGFPQIIGENHRLAGYDTPQEMVIDFLKDEDNQLEGMINFIKNAGLDDELRVMEKKLKKGQRITPDDARPFVRGYNGSGYEKNNYHTIFARNVNKWAAIPDTPLPQAPVVTAGAGNATGDAVSPSLAAGIDLYDGTKHVEIEAVQRRLAELGYPEFGDLDGKWGTKTRAAILAFRADNSLPLEPTIDKDLMSALMMAKPRYVNPARANATAADLRKQGASDIKAADNTQVAGAVTVGAGAIAAGGEVLDKAEGYGGLIQRASKIIDPVKDFIQDNFWLFLIGAGLFVVWQSGVLKNIRVRKHQTGEDVTL